MDALLNLLILYIIFMLFSSLFRKVNMPKRSQSQQSPSASKISGQVTALQKLGEDIQTNFKRYFGKMNQFQNQPPQQLASSYVQPSASSSSEAFVLPENLTLEATDKELERILTPPPQRIAQDILSSSQHLPQKKKTNEIGRSESLIGAFRHPHSVLQGIITAEILGPPLSKRSRKFERNA